MEQTPQDERAVSDSVENMALGPHSTIEQLGALALGDASILDPHQVEAFNDIVDFYRYGGRDCYAVLPTGTGKTPIYVELCKELIKSQEGRAEKPRVVVLVSTVDLIPQTIGKRDPKTGKAKGFTAFAPELTVLPYCGSVSSTNKRKALLKADVVVSTYNSFRNIVSGFERAKLKSSDEWKQEQIEQLAEADRENANANNLGMERRIELRELYNKQEVIATNRAAKVLLVGYDRMEKKSAEDVKRVETLNDIVEVCTSERLYYGDRLRELRRLVSKAKTDRVSRGIDHLESISMKANQIMALRQHAAEEGLTAEETRDRLQGPTTQSMEDSMDFLDLDDYEKFLVRFIRQHRLSRGLSIGMLTSRDDRDYIKEFTYQIQNSRARATIAKNRAKLIDNYLLLLETGDRFNLIICDEAHRAIGTQTWESIEAYSIERGVPVLGLTATDSYFERSLEDYFDKKAHDLPRQEAIMRHIINPVSIFVKETNLAFEGVAIDSVTGDYDRKTMRQLAESEERNMIGVDYAKLLSEQGYHGIMSGVPGGGGAHAVRLAQLLNETVITDPKTGQTRNLRARYVLGTTPKELRQQYYEEFERGDLDWLTFIDVIREGWDSNKAKALINLRPTRSLLLATQRVGRIGRKDRSPDPRPSILVDLYDEISGFEDSGVIPPVTGADIYELDNIQQGYLIGGNEEDAKHPAILALQSFMNQTISAHHNRYIDMLENSVIIDQRNTALPSETNIRGHWQTFEGLFKRYKGYISVHMIEAAMQADASSVRTMKGRQGYRLATLYNVDDVDRLYGYQPEIDPLKLINMPDNTKRITAEGCTILLSKKYPHINADDITVAIDQLEEESGIAFDRQVAKVRINFFSGSSVRKSGFVYTYNLDDIVNRLVPYL